MRYNSAELFFTNILIENFFENSCSFILWKLFIIEIVRIDKKGFLDDCIEDLAKELDLDNPQVVRYIRPPTLMELLTAKTAAREISLPLQAELEQLAKPPHIKAIWLGR